MTRIIRTAVHLNNPARRIAVLDRYRLINLSRGALSPGCITGRGSRELAFLGIRDTVGYQLFCKLPKNDFLAIAVNIEHYRDLLHQVESR